MPREIDVPSYCQALLTWARLAARSDAERALLDAACDDLRTAFTGSIPVDLLCAHLRQWARARDEQGLVSRLALDISKSCLLDRLLYAGEALRTRPCPIHRGRWSGCPPKPCPAGCNFGINVTGWLAEPHSSPRVEIAGDEGEA